jgi:Holliday junction resolvase RusA-like endonuclease
MKLNYIIEGDPIAWARAKPNFASRRMWDSQKQEKLVIGLSLVKQHGNNPPFSGPVHLEVNFYMRLPKKGKNHGDWYSGKPDSSNLLKFIEDSGNKILYIDDCLLVWIDVKKRYDHHPRTEFTIERL